MMGMKRANGLITLKRRLSHEAVGGGINGSV